MSLGQQELLCGLLVVGVAERATGYSDCGLADA